MVAQRVEQVRGAHHVGGERLGDRAEGLADVRRAGEVEHQVRPRGGDGVAHHLPVGHLEHDPPCPRPLGHDVSRPGVQLDAGLGVEQAEQVGADEAGRTRDEDLARHRPGRRSRPLDMLVPPNMPSGLAKVPTPASVNEMVKRLSAGMGNLGSKTG